MMSTLKAKLTWLLWLILGIGIAILTLMVRKLFSSPSEQRSEAIEVKTPEIIKKKVEKAEEEYLKVKIENEVKTEELQIKVEEIAKIEDGSERRKRLAELINNSKGY